VLVYGGFNSYIRYELCLTMDDLTLILDLILCLFVEGLILISDLSFFAYGTIDILDMILLLMEPLIFQI
jgi:hypothetical protein